MIKTIILSCIICVFSSCTTEIQDVNVTIIDEIIEEITEETIDDVPAEIFEQIHDTISITRVASEEGRTKAFTDITFFDNQFFLVFRESDKHAFGEDGVIHIFNSIDGFQWNFIKEITMPGIDLRDPSFALNGEELSMYIHGSKYENQIITQFSAYNLKYSKINGWLAPTDVLLDNLTVNTNNISGNEAWPWRITWHNGTAYTVGYNGSNIFDLYTSEDGLFFKRQYAFENIPFVPSEARIRVDANGEFFVLVRRNTGSTLLGRSHNPSEEWEWFCNRKFGSIV